MPSRSTMSRRQRGSRPTSPMCSSPAISSRLSGDLGAGKTTFARALIRYLAQRSRHRRSKPDFHADAELRSAALSADPCGSLSAVGTGRTRRTGLRGFAGRSRGAARMAGPRGGIPARRPPRHRAHLDAAAGPRDAQRAPDRLWRFRAAHRTLRGVAPLPRAIRLCRRAARAHAGRRLHALLRTAHIGRANLDPDEFSAAARWPARCATASPTAPSRILRKT